MMMNSSEGSECCPVRDAILIDLSRFWERGIEEEKKEAEEEPEEGKLSRKRVLLFPPLSSYHRFLIHRLVERHYPHHLSTFSVGLKSLRRCVVAYTEAILNHINSTDDDADPARNLASSINDIHSEIAAVLGPRVQIIDSPTDYLSLIESRSSTGAGDNPEVQRPSILELYAFPPELKTKDLTRVLDKYSLQTDATDKKYYELRWVDDTSALALVADENRALTLLDAFREDNIKLQSLDEASPNAKSKAASIFANVLPFKPRPDTSTVVARRMFHAALGIKTDRKDKNVREGEEKLRKARIEKRRASADQRN